MSQDNIPHPDEAFNLFVGPFSTYASVNAVALGLATADTAALATAVGNWSTAFPIHNAAVITAQTTQTAKDAARTNVETLLRPMIQQIQANPKVTDAQRAAMNLNLRSKSHTPAAVPTTVPVATVDTSQRLQHTISYRDSATPNSTQKPHGVAYCEIWAKVGGPAPTDASQLVYLGNASSSPQLEAFTGAQAGLPVWYWLRWVNTLGDKGPWSAPATATIQG